MKHSIVHFEIPVDNVERGKAFYSQLFDWSFSSPPGFEDYWGVDLSQGEANQGVGMMKRQAPTHGPTCYFQVGSVADYTAKVEKLGGKILMPKSPVPGMGWFANCQDTEGNVFGLWESDTSAG